MKTYLEWWKGEEDEIVIKLIEAFDLNGPVRYYTDEDIEEYRNFKPGGRNYVVDGCYYYGRCHV